MGNRKRRMYCKKNVFDFVTLSCRTFTCTNVTIHWQLNWHMRNSFSWQHIQSFRYNLLLWWREYYPNCWCCREIHKTANVCVFVSHVSSIQLRKRIELKTKKKKTNNFAPIFPDAFNLIVRCRCMCTKLWQPYDILEFIVDVSTAAKYNVNGVCECLYVKTICVFRSTHFILKIFDEVQFDCDSKGN